MNPMSEVSLQSSLGSVSKSASGQEGAAPLRLFAVCQQFRPAGTEFGDVALGDGRAVFDAYRDQLQHLPDPHPGPCALRVAGLYEGGDAFQPHLLRAGYAPSGTVVDSGRSREIVDMMLQNAVMYILFESEETPEGAPGEMEVARLPLDSFQTLWREVCPDYASTGR